MTADGAKEQAGFRGFEGQPETLGDANREERMRLAARHLALSDALRAMLLAFSRQGIRCAPLRGLALAEQLYSDPAFRPMGDLDLLVRKRDLPAVAMILKGMSYRLCDRRPGFAQEFSYTLEFFTTTPIHVIVEPHWTIAYPPFVDRLDMEPVWRRCVPARFLDVDTQMLKAEDCLLNLCLHLIHHANDRPLLWVHELDRFVRKAGAAFDWSLFWQTATQAGVERLAMRALEEARALFSTPFATCQTRGATPISRLIEDVAIPGKESLAGWCALKDWRAKWRYAAGILFPSAAFMRLHYGLSSRWQLVGWYVKRPMRLCVQALVGFGQLLSGSSRRRWS